MYLSRKSSLNLLITLLIPSMFALNGCSSDNDEDIFDAADIPREQLIGSWAFVEYEDSYMILEEDGNGEYDFPNDNWIELSLKFRWRLDANVLTITNNQVPEVNQIFDFNGKTMTLQAADGVRTEFAKE